MYEDLDKEQIKTAIKSQTFDHIDYNFFLSTIVSTDQEET